MLTLSITQISENKDAKKYQWTIRENYRLIASGKVSASKDGWEALVQQILDERKPLDR